MTTGAGSGALDGVLVADFSRVLAGPYMTMLLGDMGATVIKVESPEGDQTRAWGPPWRDGESTYFQGANRNKKSVVLNLRDPADRELAAELARRADVLVENLLPKRMRLFGLDYETVERTNPGVVYCSLTGFGSQPAGAELPGFDLVAQAASGLMSVTGDSDGPPTKVGVAVVDVLCGLYGGMAVLAALRARDRLGRGQLVEVNLLSSALSALVNQTAGFTMAGSVPGRLGNAHPSVAPYEVYRAADGDVVIAAGTERQFRGLCDALGLGRLAEDERFATNSARVAHREELRGLLDARLASLGRDQVVDLLQLAGVPATVVNDIGAAFSLAARLQLDALWTIDGVDHVRAPFFMSETAPRPTSGAPALDGHGPEIRSWLGGGRGEDAPRPGQG